jgi:hypothetical protein
VHYECVARRTLVALGGSHRPFVLVTGDPSPNPECVSEALGKIIGPGYATIIIPCRPELRRADFERTILPQATAKADIGGEPKAGSLMPALRVLLFDGFAAALDRLARRKQSPHSQTLAAVVRRRSVREGLNKGLALG